MTDKPVDPNAADKLKNFAELAAQIAKNPKMVPIEEYSRRLNICRACQYFNEKQSTCRRCGCFMKAKAKFKAAKCPENIW